MPKQLKNEIIAGLFSRLSLESCVYLQKKYTFLNDLCIDLELDRSMRRDYVAV